MQQVLQVLTVAAVVLTEALLEVHHIHSAVLLAAQSVSSGPDPPVHSHQRIQVIYK
jgi:hypothetical protein